jgi:hypothetical protein
VRTGKLKVFKEHLDWWEEFRLYHYKDGKVVKEGGRSSMRDPLRPDDAALRQDVFGRLI